MGKIKNIIFELAEDILEFLEYNNGATVDEIDEYMRVEGTASEEEYQFYQEYKDDILDIVSDEVGPLPESLSEASGMKSKRGFDVSDWGSKRARIKMGYGKGNRANYNPEDEIEEPIDPEIGHAKYLRDTDQLKSFDDDFDMEPSIEDIAGDVTVSHGERKPYRGMAKTDDIDWPEELKYGDDDWDEDDDVPYPGGLTQDDYDLDYDHDQDEDIYPTNESFLMPTLNEYFDDEERKDPNELSGHTINGKPVTWREYWRWKEEEGEYEPDEDRWRKRY